MNPTIQDGCRDLPSFPQWNKRRPERETLTTQAVEFVGLLLSAEIPLIALENPIGRIGTAIRKADQIIHPYQFGHDASKQTALWLKGLPKLTPTAFVPPRLVCSTCGAVYLYGTARCLKCGDEDSSLKPRWANQTDSGQNRLAPSDHRATDRARTYTGIAAAMAAQWVRR